MLADGTKVEMVKELFTTPLNAQNSLDAIEYYLIQLNAGNEANVLVGANAIRSFLNHLVAHDYLNKKKGSGDDAKSIFYELTNRVKSMKVKAKIADEFSKN